MRRYSMSNPRMIGNIISSCTRSLSSRPTQLVILLICLAIILSYTTFDVMYWSESGVSESITSGSTSRCNWKLGDPVFMNIKTSLGVNYDGGHWFHMSENLMTLHTVLRNERTVLNSNVYNNELYSDRYIELSNAKEVFYNFDKSSFLGDLNGVTRLLTTLGLSGVTNADSSTLKGHIQTETAYFVHTGTSALPGLTSGGHLAPLSHFMQRLPRDKCQKIALRNVTNEKKFLLTPDTGCGATHMGHQLRQHSSVVGSVAGTSAGEERCVKYITPNTFGGVWPTKQRGHWFPSPYELPYTKPGKYSTDASGEIFEEDSAADLRTISQLPTEDLRSSNLVSFYDKMNDLCPPASPTPPTSDGKEVLHVTIYQRDLNRKVINLEETVRMLEEHALSALRAAGGADQRFRFEVQVVMHENNRSPCTLRDLLSRTVVLFTPHGFQSLLVLLLPNGVTASTMPFIPLLFEVFPYRYYKRAYGPLSKELAVHHSSAMSPVLTDDRATVLSLLTTTNCMLWSKYCREYARGDNVKFTHHALNHLLQEIRFKIAPQIGAAV